MNWFNNLKTSAKLLTGFGLVLALIAMLGITSRLAMDAMERAGRIAVLEYGVVRSRPTEPLPRRLEKIHRELGALIETYSPRDPGMSDF